MDPVAKRGRSEMWEHFNLISPNKVQCVICNQQLAYNNNTSSMLRHFRAKHDTSARAAASSQDSRKDNIDEALVNMIVKDLQPFSIVDDKGFRAFVSLLDPTYVLPSRLALKSMVDARYKREKEKAKEIIQKAPAVSLTSDMWTSIHMDAYLAITCHFINESDELTSMLLTVRNFPERHTAANIAKDLATLMEEWDTQSKRMCLVTDGAANMLACANNLDARHSHCIAHALNLVVRKALDLTPGLEDMRGKARKVAAYFRTSTLARERLLFLQRQMEAVAPVHQLIQEVDTRWNSTFDMLSRLYEQREPVSAALASLHTDVAPLTSAEYDTISECLEVLSPLKEATVELSAEKSVSGSKVIPLIRMLRHSITSKQRQVRGDVASKLCSNIVQLMNEKLCHYETASQHSLATLLDPRFKVMGFCNATNSETAVKRLTAKCATLLRNSSTTLDPPQPAASTSAESSVAGLWDLLDSQVSEKRKVSSATANATVEVQRYLVEPNIPRGEDPLKYWAKHKHVYPSLYELAKEVLCIPASSVPCERVFSKAGEVVSKKRNRLSPGTVEKILFLNKNDI